MTPLMLAVKDNKTSVLDRMIDLGSDVGARNNVSPSLLCGNFFPLLKFIYCKVCAVKVSNTHNSQNNIFIL